MSDIELVLAHLKEELSILKIELENCLRDFDYEGAHLFHKNIVSKSNEINTVVRRIQSNYDEIKNYRRDANSVNHSIKRLEERLTPEIKNEKIRNVINQRIIDYKEELNALNNRIISLYETNQSEHIDNDTILIEIENILESKTSILCLEIFESELFYISIFQDEDKIKIEFLKSSLNERDRKFYTFVTRYVIKLGFQKNHFHNWILSIDCNEIDANKILQIISSLCFDVVRPSKKATYNLIIREKSSC